MEWPSMLMACYGLLCTMDGRWVWGNISNTTHSVSFRRYPYSDLKRAFHLIAKHREVIYQIPEGAFHLISRHREKNIIWTDSRRSVLFHPISNHREAILYIKHDSQFFMWYPDTKKSEKWVENKAQDPVIMVSVYRIKDWVECLI